MKYSLHRILQYFQVTISPYYIIMRHFCSLQIDSLSKSSSHVTMPSYYNIMYSIPCAVQHICTSLRLICLITENLCPLIPSPVLPSTPPTPSGDYHFVELLDHMVILFLVFWWTSLLFSIVAVAIYTPTSSAQGFSFLYILTNACYFLPIC